MKADKRHENLKISRGQVDIRILYLADQQFKN